MIWLLATTYSVIANLKVSEDDVFLYDLVKFMAFCFFASFWCLTKKSSTKGVITSGRFDVGTSKPLPREV